MSPNPRVLTALKVISLFIYQAEQGMNDNTHTYIHKSKQLLQNLENFLKKVLFFVIIPFIL
jgi:CHASE3 domain sensor protein